MRVYKFPFDKIKKEKARIILYGMSDMGRQYLAQCMSEDNISVLFAVDANSTLPIVKMHDIQVYYPGILAGLKEDEFDYIVIAIKNDTDAQYIKDSIIKMGIVEEKIIRSIRYYDDRKCLYSHELNRWYKPSFSYFGEDLVVSGLFQSMNIEKPSYLDVGCNHPYEGNNTALLYLKGSNGVNIDANLNCIQLMNEERPDDVNICVGVCGKGECEKDFFLLSDYEGLNSFDENYIKNYIDTFQIKRDEVRTIKVRCLSLKDIVDTYCNGVFPDYFDLDVEGLDDEVIASYDFTCNGPKIICVESHSGEVCEQMISQGYVRYFSTVHNVIYVKRNLIDSVLAM
ncbi:MAG: FkbM family methyltransferase [Lachnospiraceae bacterium]|nr:FkbM family methyltransferase [Lachnospiraceae bacterium]